MNAYGLDFHHLGLAVPKSELAKTFLGDLGYRLGEPVYDSEQNVNLSLCTAEHFPDVEVIWPGEGKTPIDGLLSRHSALVYHMCFATDDLDSTLVQIERAGHRAVTLSPPKPAILFNGLNVSFYEVVGFGTIEILDRRPEC
jgi:hypothetical protein